MLWERPRYILSHYIHIILKTGWDLASFFLLKNGFVFLFLSATSDEKMEEVGRGDKDNWISVFTRYIHIAYKIWMDETECEALMRHFFICNADPERFRFARDTSFGRRHLNFWSKSTITLWIACFFRQFFGSVTKVDYLTLRHGFIMVKQLKSFLSSL